MSERERERRRERERERRERERRERELLVERHPKTLCFLQCRHGARFRRRWGVADRIGILATSVTKFGRANMLEGVGGATKESKKNNQ